VSGRRVVPGLLPRWSGCIRLAGSWVESVQSVGAEDEGWIGCVGAEDLGASETAWIKADAEAAAEAKCGEGEREVRLVTPLMVTGAER
jgi:hypothetical protein